MPPSIGAGDRSADPVRLGVRLLALLLLAALAPRVTGILWGGVHPDENIGMSAKVLTGQLIPDFHYYPPFLNYLCAAAFAGLYAAGRLLGFWWSAAEFRELYFVDQRPFLFAARAVTVLVGALAAPIAALVVAQLGVRRWGCVVIGLLVAVVPVHVQYSHFSKADADLATAVLAVAWAALRCTDRAPTLGALALLAVTIGLAGSFKHSAILFVGPLMLGVGFHWAVREGAGYRTAAIRLAGIGVASLGLWCVLNVGAVLDLSEFIRYQRVQALMSVKEWSPTDSVLGTGGVLVGFWTGPGVLMVVAWAAMPFVLKGFAARLLWGASLAGLVAVGALVGRRAPEYLFLPSTLLVVTLGGAALVSLASRPRAEARWGGRLALATAFLLGALGTARLALEAVAPTQTGQVATLIRSIGAPGEVRILAHETALLGVPVSEEAMRDQMARHVRLAERYSVTLPAQAERPGPEPAGAYYALPIPYAIGGLEEYDESQVDTIVPFAWPLQPEEFDLDRWIAAGFNVFVVAHEDSMLRSPVGVYREFFASIRERCDLVGVVPAGKPRFLESELKVYRVRRAQ
ncbi:MAG: phospholipid carrier-dependent glycosyltransferase [Phycisphaerales bacterium]